MKKHAAVAGLRGPARQHLRRIVAISVGLVAAVAFTTAASAGHRAGGLRFFDTNCAPSHIAYDDPIVMPDQPGMAMQHQFYGNQSTDAFSTSQSLIAFNLPFALNGSRTTCGPVGVRTSGDESCAAYDASGLCPAHREEDGSAYWHSVIYDCGTTDPGPNPPASACRRETMQAVHVYYLAFQPVGGPAVRPFPVGFAQVSHDNTWRCLGGAGNRYAGTYRSIDSNVDEGGNGSAGFKCGGSKGGVIRLAVSFPECWNGVGLISDDVVRGEQNMAHAVHKACPAGYPILLPRLSLQADFQVDQQGIGHYYRLSMDDSGMLASTTGGHADFMDGWNPTELQTLVNNCLNTALKSGSVPGCNVAARG
jgi:hypothetical protein